MTFEEWFTFSKWEEQPNGPSRAIAQEAWHARDAEITQLREALADMLPWAGMSIRPDDRLTETYLKDNYRRAKDVLNPQ